LITSRNNPIIKEVRKLREAARSRRSAHFLVEGIHQVGAALEANWPIECLIYAPDLLSSDYGKQIVLKFSGRVEAVSAAVFESIAGKDNPQGVLAIGQRQQFRLDSARASGPSVALVSPQDPGNVGAILRTLDATAGCTLFLLDRGVDPYHPTAVRAAAGASFVVPVIESPFDEFDVWRRAAGFVLLGTSAHAKTDYRDLTPREPWILLMGSEQKGLADSHKQACDHLVRLPMRGRATSLNLAVAAGVLLYEYAGRPPSVTGARAAVAVEEI
jgi:TrmH family RNA methyltransferase